MKNGKTMDEVWEDVNLASLSDLTDENLSTTLSLRTDNQNSQHTSNFTVQDFFSGASDRDSSQPRIFSPHFIPPIPPVMSLNTACGFDFLESRESTVAGHGSHFKNQNGSNVHCLTSKGNHVGMGSVSDANCSNGKKRFQEYGRNISYRRQLRKIKTREAAARSRARKMTRLAALENARVELREANANLRMMNKELLRAAAAKRPEKGRLFRAYTV